MVRPGKRALYAAFKGDQLIGVVERILSETSVASDHNSVKAIRRGDVNVKRALFISKSRSKKFEVEECVQESKKMGDRGYHCDCKETRPEES